MKINRIHIISFGGLKNYTLDFSEGFNCIYGENEQGKTTIMSFIKMMFYGNERGSSQISKNIRKKYTPWDGSQMAGSIEFDIDGKAYKLEREFRSSNSTDRVSLTDLSLGEKQSVESDIGVRLFGLSGSAFERSIFIGQLGFPDSDSVSEGEINAKLSNIVTTGDETLSLEEISSRLEKEKFSLISKSGKAGEFYKNSLILNELNDKLSHSIASNRRYIEGKEGLIAHSKETAILCKKADSLKLQISKEQDIKNAHKLRELLETKAKLEDVKKETLLSDGTPADDNTLRNLRFALSKLENAKKMVTAKEKETEIIKNQLDTLINGPKLSTSETPESLDEDLKTLNNNLLTIQNKAAETNEKIATLNTKKNNTKAILNLPLLIIGVILLISSAVAVKFSLIFTLILGCTGVISAILSFIFKADKKSAFVQEEIYSLEGILSNLNALAEDIKAQIIDKKSKLEAINLANSSNRQVIETVKLQLQNFENQLLSLKNEQIVLEEDLSKLLIRLNSGLSAEQTLEKLDASCQKQKELKQHINFLLKDLNNISYDDAEIKLKKIENSDSGIDIDFERIKAEYEALQNLISERKSKESALATELKALLNGIESPDVLQIKIKEINEIMNSQKTFCDSADIALDVLKESFAELRAGFGSQLERISAEIFSSITENKYNNMTVSKSFEINVIETHNPISREAEYLSSGTYDQAYLSMRLAVARLLGDELPLFLDDTLTQYDDIRAKATLKFLKDYTASSQAIMFTCHKSIYDFADTLGCSLNKL